MMYVQDNEEIRDYILNGSAGRHDHGSSSGKENGASAIIMPGFQEELNGTDLEDLVAAFRASSGMSVPAADTPARRGYDLALEWKCFSCHGVAASGGLPNPRSFTGFIPGWYGPDFDDLVRSRREFDSWILEGGISRLEQNTVAAYFMRRQKIIMPKYMKALVVKRPLSLASGWAASIR